MNLAKVSCKLDIWGGGESGIKKERKKKLSTLDLEMPRAFISMGNVFQQQFLPWLLSGHDLCVCVLAGLMPSLSWDSAFLCVEDFFRSSSFELFRLQLC